MKKTHLVIAICLASASAAYGQTEIDEVLVYGQQMNSEVETGSRLDLTPMETPATIDVIRGDDIRARIDLTVIDAVTRSGGFTNAGAPGNGGSSIAARGFSGQGVVTKLFDGTHYYQAFSTVTFPFDTWGVERIEVLKGPSSVLYGEGGIGGAINIIPKSPTQETERELRFSLGENSTTFFGFGAGGGLTEDLAYRVDISNSQSDNWVRNGESENTMFSGALEWQTSERLSLTARYDYGDQDPMEYFGTVTENGDFHPDFIDENYNPSDSEVSYTDDSMRLKAEYQISDNMAFDSEIYRMTSDRYWSNVEGYTLEENGGSLEILRNWTTLIAHDIVQQGWRSNLSNAFEAGGMPVKTNIGIEFTDISLVRPVNWGSIDLFNYNGTDETIWGYAGHVDAYNPDVGSITDWTTEIPNPNVESDVSQIGIFAESQVQYTDQLALVLALRYEDLETDYWSSGGGEADQQVDDITGRVGLVYDLNESTAIYGQYATGSEHPGGGVVRVSSSTINADLTKTEQVEIGIKQNLIDQRLSWELALFDITKNDQLIVNNPDLSDARYIDEQTSQGIELSINAQISDRFGMYANVVSLDAEVTGGSRPDLVPERTFNLGVSASLTNQLTWLADSRYVGNKVDSGAEIRSYNVVDTSLRYQPDSGLAFTAKLENAFDEIYASTATWTGNWLVGKRRTFSLTADLSF